MNLNVLRMQVEIRLSAILGNNTINNRCNFAQSGSEDRYIIDNYFLYETPTLSNSSTMNCKSSCLSIAALTSYVAS